MIKLNVCCGDDYREGYVNIDFSSIKSDGKSIKVDLICDILKGMPYEDNSADEIVFRESLEHFAIQNGIKVLRELYRVLKPGGKLDLTVPPALKQIKLLMLEMMKPREVPFEEFERAHEVWGYWKRHSDLMGATTESDGKDGHSHKTLFTKQTLKPILEHVGFKIISIDDNIHVKATK